MPTTESASPRIDHELLSDLIGNPPGWLLRSGISLIALAVVCFLSLAAWVSYPDKIVAEGYMTSEFPPIPHVSHVNGMLDSLCVEDDQLVIEDQALAYLHSTAFPQDVEQVKLLLAQMDLVAGDPGYFALELPADLQLGELQTSYANLELKVKELQLLLRQTNVSHQIKKLSHEAVNTTRLSEVLLREKQLTAEELSLKERNYQRNQTLEEEGVISHLEAEKIAVEFLQSQKQFNNLENGILSNEIKSEQLRLEALKLREEHNARLTSLMFAIQEGRNTLLQEIRAWEEQYIIRATISGRFALLPQLTENVPLKGEEIIGYVIPEAVGQTIVAQVVAASEGIGKIQPGHKVLIKVAGYPYKEYGVLVTAVETVAPLPSRDKDGKALYTLHLPLQQPLLTQYGKEIPYQPQTPLEAEIITEEKSILARIFEQFLDLFKNV